MPRIDFSLRGPVPLILITMTLVGQSWLAFGEDTLPTAFDRSRYESLRTKSPFAIATAVATPTPQASFAANWFITGVARNDDKNFVTIKSRDLVTQFSLYGDEAVDGVTLASVNWSDTIGKSTVVLRKGTETAKLEFNEAQLRSPTPATAASPPPVGNKPMGTNTAVPVPHLPAPNAGPARNAPAAPNGAPGVPRRRVLPVPMPR